MDWSMRFFGFGTLLYIIEEVKLSIKILVLYKLMLSTFFIRKDSINFLWFTLPIWYRSSREIVYLFNNGIIFIASS